METPDSAEDTAPCSRLGGIMGYIALGCGVLGLNWYLLRTHGIFSPSLAIIAPWPLAWAGHCAIFPEDLGVGSGPMPLRMVPTLVACLTLGFANLYAIRYGLY